MCRRENVETDLSTQKAAPPAGTRIFKKDADPCWPRGYKEASPEGQEAPVCLRQAFPPAGGEVLLAKEGRITTSRDFRRVYRSGNKKSGRFLKLYYLVNKHGSTRFGYSISKKVGKAVIRNRLKRRLRAICRQHLAFFQPGIDVVLVARERAVDASYGELEKEVLNLSRGEKILVNGESEPLG